MLRGKVGVNIHCYETEDFWDMIHHSKEFGFRIQAFHHALEAWKVPEMIKDSGELVKALHEDIPKAHILQVTSRLQLLLNLVFTRRKLTKQICGLAKSWPNTGCQSRINQ
jgi:hypothetical protein